MFSSCGIRPVGVNSRRFVDGGLSELSDTIEELCGVSSMVSASSEFWSCSWGSVSSAVSPGENSGCGGGCGRDWGGLWADFLKGEWGAISLRSFK